MLSSFFFKSTIVSLQTWIIGTNQCFLKKHTQNILPCTWILIFMWTYRIYVSYQHTIFNIYIYILRKWVLVSAIFLFCECLIQDYVLCQGDLLLSLGIVDLIPYRFWPFSMFCFVFLNKSFRHSDYQCFPFGLWVLSAKTLKAFVECAHLSMDTLVVISYFIL